MAGFCSNWAVFGSWGGGGVGLVGWLVFLLNSVIFSPTVTRFGLGVGVGGFSFSLVLVSCVVVGTLVWVVVVVFTLATVWSSVELCGGFGFTRNFLTSLWCFG